MTDLIQRLRRVVSECNEGIPIFVAVVHPSMLHEAADELERQANQAAAMELEQQAQLREIERLSREIASAGSIAAVNARQCEIITRLTRERDECASTLAHATRLLNDALESKTALRAALEHIIRYEAEDMDGNPMPESGAQFIAREALAGEADKTKETS